MRPMILTTLATYSRADFGRDAVAGITVAMVALPLSLAIAIASGAEPATGLVTAIIGGFMISLLGGSGTITRTILAGNDIGMSVKAGCDATLDHVTIAENASIGLQDENKTGSDAASFYTVTNSIIVDADAVMALLAERTNCVRYLSAIRTHRS